MSLIERCTNVFYHKRNKNADISEYIFLAQNGIFVVFVVSVCFSNLSWCHVCSQSSKHSILIIFIPKGCVQKAVYFLNDSGFGVCETGFETY